jgi:hypothetical protein
MLRPRPGEFKHGSDGLSGGIRFTDAWEVPPVPLAEADRVVGQIRVIPFDKHFFSNGITGGVSMNFVVQPKTRSVINPSRGSSGFAQNSCSHLPTCGDCSGVPPRNCAPRGFSSSVEGVAAPRLRVAVRSPVRDEDARRRATTRQQTPNRSPNGTGTPRRRQAPTGPWSVEPALRLGKNVRSHEPAAFNTSSHAHGAE